MTEFLNLNEDNRRLLIDQVSTITGISAKALEKDWWVTLVLKALFELPMAEHFIFKGGTSLSKGWKLLERFSEDIDIALAPEAFNRTYEKAPSSSWVKRLKKEGCEFTSTVIRHALEQQLFQMGVPADMIRVEAEEVKQTQPDKDPQVIYVRYPSLYEPNAYLTEPVKIEFGVRSLREPYSKIEVRSLLSESHNSRLYHENPFNVTAVEPRKTFIEKMILLHEKFQSGRVDSGAGERQSRHLSDIHRMMIKDIVKEVMNDYTLYQTVVEHRRYYSRLRDVNYDAMGLQHLLFIPPFELLEAFRRDYETMRSEMIYGEAPGFDDLLQDLRELNQQLAGIGHQKKMTEVIAIAKQQLSITEQDHDFLKTLVVYTVDPSKPTGTDNMNLQFSVEFVLTKNGYQLHRVSVV
jgi:hypothetical protein